MATTKFNFPTSSVLVKMVSPPRALIGSSTTAPKEEPSNMHREIFTKPVHIGVPIGKKVDLSKLSPNCPIVPAADKIVSTLEAQSQGYHVSVNSEECLIMTGCDIKELLAWITTDHLTKKISVSFYLI